MSYEIFFKKLFFSGSTVVILNLLQILKTIQDEKFNLNFLNNTGNF